MSRNVLKQAQTLIRDHRYEEAAIILRDISDDSTAQKWLAKLESENLIQSSSDSLLAHELEQLFTYDSDRIMHTKWEYRNVSISLNLGIFSGKNRVDFIEEDVGTVMNDYGEQGWELVNIYWSHVHAGITGAVLTFKRRKS